MALTRGAIALAIATGAVMSAPLLMTPCGSSVPVGKRTVCTFDGTASLNSIQLMRSISRVETTSRAAGGEGAEFFRVCAAATKALAAANSKKTTDTEILISFPSRLTGARPVALTCGVVKCRSVDGQGRYTSSERKRDSHFPLTGRE